MNATMPATTLSTSSTGSMFVGLRAKLLALTQHIRPMDGIEMTFDQPLVKAVPAAAPSGK